MKKGIDVSSWQGRIDWTKVKPYIDFAIIRCGYGNDEERYDDIYYERNTLMCEDNHIPYGVYLYSYATTLDDALSEVNHTLRLVKNKKLEYPIFLDVESSRQMALPKSDLIEIVKYYCQEIEKHGYYVGIYSSLNRFRDNLDSKWLDAYDKWVAEWNNLFTYDKPAGMWQYTSLEGIPGIKGRVDGDIAFYDYPKIIRNAKLNHLDNSYKYKVGDVIYITGPVYSDSNALDIKERVCHKLFKIEDIIESANAPYKISIGYVKEDSIDVKDA